MSLESGQVLAHCRLVEKIGEGGMGVVWKAVDTTLDREVAIKVLPDAFIADPLRLERFEREARLLASLNHPRVAALHGLHDADGVRFLTMELITGEDLAERLRRGPVPLDQALPIALQIAEGLEAAHESGILHRDLKPANIKLTAQGDVKILDFGLAKAFDDPAGERDVSLTQSPTMTAMATRAGVLLGTAAYMSPEQARGEPVDKRADVWAFGCVLLEMLTGSGTFSENTVSDTLASVLRSEPDWEALPSGTPPRLHELLHRCLTKDVRRRLRDIGDGRILLDEMISGAHDAAAGVPAGAGAAAPRGLWAGVTLAAMALTAALTWALLASSRPGSATAEVRKLEVVSEGFTAEDRFAPALSPDGRRVAFVRDGGLWIRALDQLDAHPVAGTQGAELPFWSPDGTFLGFVRHRGIWKVPAAGGQVAAVVTGLGSFNRGSACTWGTDDEIVFSRADVAGLFAVSARGGAPRVLVVPDLPAETDFHHPHALPDGRTILFTVHRATGPDVLEVLQGGKRKRIAEFENEPIWKPVYAPSGHILFRRLRGTVGLWALPFSIRTMAATGEPFLVTQDGGLPQASPDGALLYVRGEGRGSEQLVRVSAAGEVLGKVGQPHARITMPSVSRDGGSIALIGRDDDDWDVWVHDVERGTRSRITFTTSQEWDTSWSPDGREVLFWDGETRAVSRIRADGTGRPERLLDEQFADSGDPTLTPDGKALALWVQQDGGEFHLYSAQLEDRTLRPLVTGPGRKESVQLSPDGRLAAYVSDESGKNEVYLTRFPGGEGKWQVSSDGGEVPRWSHDGRRVFYLQLETLMEVEIETTPSVVLGPPERLFDAADAGVVLQGISEYAVAPDGTFLMVQRNDEDGLSPSIVLVQNWATEFTRR